MLRINLDIAPHHEACQPHQRVIVGYGNNDAPTCNTCGLPDRVTWRFQVFKNFAHDHGIETAIEER